MRQVGIVVGVIAVVFFGGCKAFLGVISSPTYHEQKIPAQFKLADRAKEKILVFVEEARGSGAGSNLREMVSDTVSVFIVKKARIKSQYLVSQRELSDLKSQRSDFSRLSPVEVGRSVGAAVVLYVRIEDYKLYEMAETGYYRGSLVTRSILFDTASGEMLWPRETTGRVVRTKVEFETKGYEATAERLTRATAHCIVRNFYDCPRDQFKVRDEQSEFLQLDG